MNNAMQLVCFLTMLTITTAQAQGELRVITAQSDQVDVRDGDEFYLGQWTIMPEYRPDVYTSSKVGEWVTFFTDQDSISYQIHPDSVYDFVILLNDQDSAFTQIKYEPTYLDILKGAAAYDYEDQPAVPQFTYQDPSTPELQILRETFNLDSIAGTGNEVSRILNLLHWIHDLIPHDGQHENPVVKNAMSMIRECKRDERGLNCRGLATVLNECYLSMGFKSRFVTCMPKDSIFDDCHVINMVYANELGKWIWVDPTHDAYIMDEYGTLLGLEEVRERLISGKTLILNPDANWNKRESTVKEYYLLQYMAKNLYRFSCPLRSEYDYETGNLGKRIEHVELIPLDGYQQTPKISEYSSKSSGNTVQTFKTNNPNLFWAKPQ